MAPQVTAAEMQEWGSSSSAAGEETPRFGLELSKGKTTAQSSCLPLHHHLEMDIQ